MNILRPLVRDQYEMLAWRITGGLLLGIFGVWLAGLSLHANSGDPAPSRASAAAELIRDDATRPVSMRTIRFAEQGRDLVALDSADGHQIKALGFERDGFVVSIVRSLERERKRLGMATGEPYRLTRWNNGQLLFEDPSTGGQIELSAFGTTNVGAFAQLLSDKPEVARR